MDLILRDKNFKKKSVVKSPDFVCNVGISGASSNDFVLTQPLGDELIPIGSILTYGTTEFGGKILERFTETANQTVKYIGKTFRGVFDNFVIGKNIFHASAGTDEEIIRNLLSFNDVGLENIYTVTGTGAIKSTSTFFDKGATLHHAIDWFLNYFNEKAIITVDSNGVNVALTPINNIKSVKLDANVIIDENKLLPTALFTNVYSGRAFLQGDGTFSNTTRYYKGLDAVEIWEEFPSDMENPTTQEQYEWAKNRLETIRRQQTTSEVFFDIENADIGDIVTVSAPKYRTSTTKTIVEKVLTIQGNNTEISCKFGG